MIRGKNVNEALAVLQYTQKRAADGIEACVRSAIANATEAAEKANIAVDPDDLWVKACFVDMGPTKNRRRMRPAPQGRAYREQRHFCHVTVLLSSDERAAVKGSRAKRGAAGAAATTTGKGSSRRSAADGGGKQKSAKASAKTATETTGKRTSKKAEGAAETTAQE
jgi:large subunit ribosomal protein L22